MREDERRQRNLERLERKRQLVNDQLERQRRRINEQFDRKQQELSEGLNHKQEQIIEEALNLLDQEGLNNLSLRKLARLVNMQAPALYWHFKSKEALIDHMAEAILQPEFEDLRPLVSGEEPWQDWLIDVCKRLRSAMSAHRDGARIVAGAHPYPAVTLMKLLEVSQASLVNAGVSEREATLIIGTAIHFTFGRVIEEQSSPDVEELEAIQMSGFLDDYPYIEQSTKHMVEDIRNGYDQFEASLRLIVGASS